MREVEIQNTERLKIRNNLNIENEKLNEDLNKKTSQLKRAEKYLNDVMSKAKSKNVEVGEGSNIDLECKLAEEKTRYDFLINAISILCRENPSLKEAISNQLQEKKIEIPDKPKSEKSSQSDIKSISDKSMSRRSIK